jgi:hypothetical protein
MATVKRVNTTYTIKTPEVIVEGNLTVKGTQTSVESVNTVITDRIITLNNGELGAGVGGVSPDFAGIEVDRGSLDTVNLRWNELTDQWQVTNNGTTWANIVGSSTGITRLYEDSNPTLSANLKVYGQTIVAGLADNIKFDGNLQINNTLTQPSATPVTNATVVYAATPAAGKAGLYVVNSSAIKEELITKTRAFGFSLIL